MPVKRRARKPAPPRSKKQAGGERAPLNLTLRKEVVARARALDLNISEIADAALEDAVRKAEHVRWLEENKDAIEYYNQWVKKHGVFGMAWRRF